ncbi:membrane-spanning protein [Terribacillus saccharophilus]|uniref:membrane-spanning protein n=1 Tax=Terribacillus saccharophilus TaxID=361277 RepID=UPI00398227C7
MKKTIYILSFLFICFMLVSFFIELKNGDTNSWTKSGGRILMSALPLALLFFQRTPFSVPHIFGYYMLLVFTFILGAIFHFYDKYKWWDITLHVIGAMYVAWLALAIYRYKVLRPAGIYISRWIIFLFVLSMAALGSAIWESIEFIGDMTVTSVMQRSGNTDTISDMIAGLLGGVILGVYALFRNKPLEGKEIR